MLLLPDYQARRGIENLKTTFLLYLSSSILILVPVVGFVGAILELLALIFLIMSWRALGRSGFSQAPNYKSTGKWLLWSIIIVIILAIAGSVIILVSFVSSLLASGTFPALQNGTGSATTFFQQSGNFGNLVSGFAALFGGLTAIWIAAWVKMSFSIKRLSVEISAPRLNTTGNLFIIQALIGYASGIITYALLFSSGTNIPSTNPGSFNPFTSFLFGSFAGIFLGGFWLVTALLSLAVTGIMIVACYFGYSSLNSYLAQHAVVAPPAAPPPYVGSSVASIQTQGKTCPQCGNVINFPSSIYCPNCGTKL